MQCEYYALEGLSQLIATIHLVRDHLNPDLAVRGVVLTMFDARTNLSAEVAAEVRTPPRGSGLRHRRAAERAPGGSAQPRPADCALRARQPRRRRLPGARDRAPGPARPGGGTARRGTGRRLRRCAAVRDDPAHARRIPVDRGPATAAGPRRRRGRIRRGSLMARPASLGRGLDALIPRAASTTPVPADIPIDRIERNPYQPRTVFEMDQLDQLRASIAAHGVLQPVLVDGDARGVSPDRGRASGPGCAARRPDPHPGHRPAGSRTRTARARAGREPPASRPERRRGGARLPPARGRVRPVPRPDREPGRDGLVRRSRTPSDSSSSSPPRSRRSGPDGSARATAGRCSGWIRPGRRISSP